jgi:uncharacterized protein
MSSESLEESDSDVVVELKGQVHESRSGIVKALLVVAGSICVVLGVMGIILPIVPTTPFLLLAAICYSHSSERFYLWLLTNRYFGQYIRDWRENKGLTYLTKFWVIFVLVVTMGISIVFFIPIFAVKVVLACIGTFITFYILSLPTKQQDIPSDESEAEDI